MPPPPFISLRALTWRQSATVVESPGSLVESSAKSIHWIIKSFRTYHFSHRTHTRILSLNPFVCKVFKTHRYILVYIHCLIENILTPIFRHLCRFLFMCNFHDMKQMEKEDLPWRVGGESRLECNTKIAFLNKFRNSCTTFSEDT